MSGCRLALGTLTRQLRDCCPAVIPRVGSLTSSSISTAGELARNANSQAHLDWLDRTLWGCGSEICVLIRPLLHHIYTLYICIILYIYIVTWFGNQGHRVKGLQCSAIIRHPEAARGQFVTRTRQEADVHR